MNRHGLAPNGFSYLLRLSPPDPARGRAGRVWGLDYPFTVALGGFRCCPSSLYTFPFPGLARDCHLTGFPDFEQFCTAGFPAGTQVWLKSVASTNFATPAHRIAIALGSASANRLCRSTRARLIGKDFGPFRLHSQSQYKGRLQSVTVTMAGAHAERLYAF